MLVDLLVDLKVAKLVDLLADLLACTTVATLDDVEGSRWVGWTECLLAEL